MAGHRSCRAREHEKHEPDEHRAKDSEEEQARGEHDARCDAPEEEHEVERFFDGRAEAHDGEGRPPRPSESSNIGLQTASITRGRGRRGCSATSRHAERRGVHDRARRLPVDQEDEEADPAGEQHRHDGVDKRHGSYAVEECRGEDVVERNHGLPSWYHSIGVPARISSMRCAPRPGSRSRRERYRVGMRRTSPQEHAAWVDGDERDAWSQEGARVRARCDVRVDREAHVARRVGGNASRR